jgi:hypothetical protein
MSGILCCVLEVGWVVKQVQPVQNVYRKELWQLTRKLVEEQHVTLRNVGIVFTHHNEVLILSHISCFFYVLVYMFYF